MDYTKKKEKKKNEVLRDREYLKNLRSVYGMILLIAILFYSARWSARKGWYYDEVAKTVECKVVGKGDPELKRLYIVGPGIDEVITVSEKNYISHDKGDTWNYKVTRGDLNKAGKDKANVVLFFSILGLIVCSILLIIIANGSWEHFEYEAQHTRNPLVYRDFPCIVFPILIYVGLLIWVFVS